MTRNAGLPTAFRNSQAREAWLTIIAVATMGTVAFTPTAGATATAIISGKQDRRL